MIVQVSATKYYHGSSNTVTYLGNLLPDGYIYFNDDTFFRCRASSTVSQGSTVTGTDLQLCYMSKEQWVRCGILSNIQITLFNGMNGSIQSIISLARTQLGNTGQIYWDWGRSKGLVSGSYVNGSATPYCALFISWLLDMCNISCIYFPNAAAFDSRDIPVASRIPASSLVAGDIVSFNWNGGTTGDHVGLVVSNNGTNIHTIEGNVSGYVTELDRGYNPILFGIRPNYTAI